jgi:hypothetical protein
VNNNKGPGSLREYNNIATLVHPFLGFPFPSIQHIAMTSSLRLSLSASAAILAWFASSVSPVDAKACVQFDAQWNLYAFGGSEDVSLGQNTTWGCE